MTDCKWNHDEFCVNDLCPMCADYCPVPNDPGVCRWEARGMVEVVRCKDCKHRGYLEHSSWCKIFYDDFVDLQRILQLWRKENQ